MTLKQVVQEPHLGASKPNNFPKEHLLHPPRTCHRQRASQGCWDSGCRAEGLRVGPGPRGGASHQAVLGPRGSEKARDRGYFRHFHQVPLCSAEGWGKPLDLDVPQIEVTTSSATYKPCVLNARGLSFPVCATGSRHPLHPRKAKPKGN